MIQDIHAGTQMELKRGLIEIVLRQANIALASLVSYSKNSFCPGDMDNKLDVKIMDLSDFILTTSQRAAESSTEQQPPLNRYYCTTSVGDVSEDYQFLSSHKKEDRELLAEDAADYILEKGIMSNFKGVKLSVYTFDAENDDIGKIGDFSIVTAASTKSMAVALDANE